jgi:RNA polymerase sigma-70 factor (ECF subfamily)
MAKEIGEEKGVSAVNTNDEIEKDRLLVSAARDGDKEAYGKLVLKYQPRLIRLVFMMLGRLDAAEDIVQEALVKAYLALDSFDMEKTFYPWISTIARNLAINQIKKNEREVVQSELDDRVPEIPDYSANPMDGLIERENDREFARAVLALPPAYRSVFVLRMFEKLSYEEIAKQLKISIGTVDSRLHRAREKLVAMLKEHL